MKNRERETWREKTRGAAGGGSTRQEEADEEPVKLVVTADDFEQGEKERQAKRRPGVEGFRKGRLLLTWEGSMGKLLPAYEEQESKG